MPQYPPERIYAAARALLPELDEATRQRTKTLLTQAEKGADTDLQILNLLTRDQDTRERLRTLLQEEGPGETLMRGYAGLGGEQSSTRPGEVYVCPVAGCETRYLIGEAGETPPPCEKHKVSLVPAEAKKER